ncbi:MAG: acetyl-CoA C-acyltransferase [Deltaproteobacteria bacterium]|nr:acetyl-CoA C-acyltransferase [Deltaproteobacteria bacterium]
MTRVAVVGGCRTPFVKAAGVFSSKYFLDLGIHVLAAAVKRSGLDPASIDEVAFSTVLYDPRLPNFAREMVLRSGLPKTLSAHSISNNCISGLVAATFISEAIQSGRIKTGIAGGSESMSRPTLTLDPRAEAFFIRLAKARSLGDKLKLLAQFRPKYILPQAPSPKEPSTGLTMGQHCELTAKEFAIARELQDRIAFLSHQNAARAQEAGYFAAEIEALDGQSKDNIIRADTTLAKLAGLKPVFDRSAQGTLTAGNSSPLTDGASAVILMAEAEAKRQGKEAMGFIDAIEFAAIDPSDGLLMAPGLALPRLMERNNLKIADVDIFEIHEAFGAQVAANLLVWEKGWAKYPSLKPIGKIPEEKINVNGGSIAIGHPFAATGGRLILSTVNELRRRKAKTGIISVCAAGAMACAMLVRTQ